MSRGAEFTVRPATHEDYDAVAAFTTNTWPDRDGTDYIPRAYHDWIDGDRRETFVVDAGEDVAGIAQAVLLTAHEAWGQGMRVNPDYRGRNAAGLLTDAVFDWSRDQGATVCRNMVFSWNQAGLGQARAAGFDPATEFRWATPEPDPDATPSLELVEDPDAAWSAWARSEARDLLRGLALDLEESWAVAELTRERLHRAAANGRVFALGEDGTDTMTFRTRTYERENQEGDSETWAEYGAACWPGLEATRSLFAAVARDAASVGADRTRVFIPEDVRHVSDVARARAGFSDEPDFVLEADLTGDECDKR